MAGFFAGYVMGVFTTIALTVLVVRVRTTVFERLVADGMNPVALAVPISLAATLGWTMAGLVFGSAYELGGLHGTRDGLGSPSLGFTLAMLGLAWVPLPVLVAVSRRLWWLWAGLSFVFAVSFGWMLPHLAGR